MFRQALPGITLAALLAIPVSDLAGQDFEWRGNVRAGSYIEVVGVLGDVTAVASSGSDVEVTAVIREHRRGNAEDVDIEVLEHGDGVTICAMYPTPRRADRDNECRPDGRTRNNTNNIDVSVHFTVHVPRGVDFLGRTVNGDVVVESLGADVEAHTVNGDVEVSTAGLAQASTVNGSVRARIGRADWDGSLEFETVNGNITVELPGGVGADVTAATVNGGIETDFPLTVSGRFSSKRITGTIGDGGRRLWLETVNGSIRILRR